MIINRDRLICQKPLKRIPSEIVIKKGNDYLMKETKSGRLLAIMEAKPKNMPKWGFEPFTGTPALEISVLGTMKPHSGLGRKMIQLAKTESLRMGCKGNLFLQCYNPKEYPDVFYRKCGFFTTKLERLKQIDSYIKNKTFLEPLDALLPMFYLHNVKAADIISRITKFTSRLH